MQPHEKALVQRMQEKPFALLGINNDGAPAEVKPRLVEAGITWRNAMEPEVNPLAQRWNVSGYPALYLIDDLGVIRYRWMGPPGSDVLDHCVEELVTEAVARGKR